MMRVQWETTATRRAPDGGDTLEVRIGELEIDAVLSETRQIGADVTSHPVEDGADISDHARPRLKAVSLECIVSNTPIKARVPGARLMAQELQLPKYTVRIRGSENGEAAQVESRSYPTVSAQVLTFPSQFDRPVEVFSQLEELIDLSKPVDLLDLRLGDVSGWMIVNVSPVIETRDCMRFTLDAQEVRTAQTEEIEAPSPRVERARRRRDEGRTAPDAEPPERLRSAALRASNRVIEAVDDLELGALIDRVAGAT